MTLLRIFFVFSMIFLLIGCSGDRKQAELQEAENQKIVDVLADIQIAESTLRRFGKNERDSVMKAFKTQIFEIHQVDSLWYDSTMAVILSEPYRYQEIYTSVADTMDSAYKVMRAK